jgi:hypothetical protein
MESDDSDKSVSLSSQEQIKEGEKLAYKKVDFSISMIKL